MPHGHHYRTEGAFHSMFERDYAARITPANEAQVRAWVEMQSPENATNVRIAGLEPSAALYNAAVEHFGLRITLPD